MNVRVRGIGIVGYPEESSFEIYNIEVRWWGRMYRWADRAVVITLDLIFEFGSGAASGVGMGMGIGLEVVTSPL